MGYWEFNKMTDEDFRVFQKLLDEMLEKEMKMKKEFRERKSHELF
jgi:hypothetical protein